MLEVVEKLVEGNVTVAILVESNADLVKVIDLLHMLQLGKLVDKVL
jgi:hypothetical protein